MNRNSIRGKVQVKLTTAALAGAILVSGNNFVSHAEALSVPPSNVEADAHHGGLTSGIAYNLAQYLEQTKVAQIARNEVPFVASAAELDLSFETEAVVEEVAEDPLSAFAGMGVSNVEDNVNIRSLPDANSEYVGKLYADSAATILESVQDAEGVEWHHIQSGSVDGYIRGDFLTVGRPDLVQAISTEIATSNTDGLNVRSDASTEAGVLTQLTSGQQVTVVDGSMSADGWVKISVNGQEGFVSYEFVSTETSFKVAESKEEEQARLAAEAAAKKAAEERVAAERRAAESRAASRNVTGNTTFESTQSAPPSGNGGSALGYAQQFVGNPYRWGGSSLTNGADCSGFVASVFAHFGVGLPHSSGAMAGVGSGVSVSDMQPGDIVVYSGHVGIYAGGGQLLSALNSRSGITYNSVNYKPIKAVRRVI